MNNEEKEFEEQEEETVKSANNALEIDNQEILIRERDDYLAGWKRALADYNNLKKFQSKEREEWMKTITSETVSKFIPLYDYLQSAVANPPQIDGISQWVDGIRHIGQQFLTIIGQFGVTKMDVIGTMFNPVFHESVGTESDKTSDDGIILKEIQAGFTLNNMVVRPAKVIINEK